MATTTKITFASLLAMVQTTADAVTKTIGVAADGVDMLSNTVESMKKKQDHENFVDLKFHNNQYTVAAAKADNEFNLSIQEYRMKSKAHADGFDASLKSIQDALAARQKAA